MKKRVIFVLIIMLTLSKVMAQNISGVVVDSKDVPLQGVSILVKGTTKGSTTDLNGKFVISNIANSLQKVLVFSYVGYEKIEKDVSNQASSLRIVLQETNKGLDEVVVVAYGSQKKESVTAAISSVSAKDLLQSPTANISNSLSGRMSGLITVQNSGKPGADASDLYIRGVGTYSSSVSPLIMVDGVARDTYNNIDPNEIETISILKDASATAVFGVRGANGVVLITTKRGKAGAPKISLSAQTAVTEFTGLPKFVNSFDYATLQNEKSYETYWINHAKDADINTWADFVAKRDANWKKEAAHYYSDDDLLKYKNAHTPLLDNGQTNPYYDPYFHPDTDWQSQIFKKRSSQTQVNLNINGGTESVKYFVSLGYLNQGGMFKTDYMEFPDDMAYTNKRYNIRGNFDFDINKDFRVSVDLGYQHEVQGGLNLDNEGWMWEKRIMWSNPITTPGIVNGKFVMPYTDTKIGDNPLEEIAGMGYNNTIKSTLTSSLKLKYKLDRILNGLSVNARVAYDSYFQTRDGGATPTLWYKLTPNSNGNPLDPIFSQMSEEIPPERWANWYVSKWRKVYGEGSLNYNHSFGKHDVGALVLYNVEKKYDPTLTPDLPHAYLGMVGRATYAYDGRYLAEFNMGYNGSENFPKGLRYGFLPAYSLGWVASNEAFFPKSDVISYLKIRGSIGKVGNDNVIVNNVSKRYLYLPNTWNYAGGYTFGTLADRNYVPGAEEGTVGNPNVTWETATKSNIGFETKLFRDKLSITFDYFNEDRKDILSYKQTIPDIVQATLPPYNLGEVKNWGWELEMTWRSKVGKLDYCVKGNLSHNKNKIVFMDETIADGLGYQAATGNPINQLLMLKDKGLYNSWADLYQVDAKGDPILSSPVLALNKSGQPYTNAAGKPVYEKDLGYNGAVVQPGEIRLEDVNEDGVIDKKDNIRIGKTNIPEFTYGVSFGFSYKGFDFSTLFQGIAGVAHYVGTRPFNNLEAITELGMERFTLERRANGEKIEFPIAAYNNSAGYNTYFLKDASYVRLKNMEVGYTLQPSFLTKLGISSTRIYLNGSNLLTWSPNKIWGDPENLGNNGYPLVRTYNLGFNVNF